MFSFNMNGINWRVIFVSPDSPVLEDRDGKLTVGCTDPITKRVYISNQLQGILFTKVLLHELCHCALVSYGLLDYIHIISRPEYWSEAEEFMCNLIADYSGEIQTIANKLRLSIH